MTFRKHSYTRMILHSLQHFKAFQLHIRTIQIEERSSQLLRNLNSREKKAWKNSGLNGIRTHDLRIPFKPEFFQAFFSQLFKLRSNCEDLSSIWSFIRSSNICFIYWHSFIHPSRVYYELTIWPAPSWLDSSVGRALHRHRRGHGFESRSSLNFFRLSFRNCLSCVVTARIFLLFDLSSAVQIYVSYIDIH